MHPGIRERMLVAVALIAAACTSGPSTPSGMGRIQFQIASTTSTSPTAPPAPSDVTVTAGSDVLVISAVQLVARKLKLEREHGACPAPVLSDAESGDHEAEDADEAETSECPNLRLGPLLLEPPVADAAATIFTVDLPAGTYDELEMQIHRPTNHTADAAFLQLHPEFEGVSIKVTGTFNGAPFTFVTDLTAEVEIEFPDAIVVNEGETTSITLQMDVRGWFVGQGGATLLSPISPTLTNRQRIEQNIRASLHVFEDEDHDGHDD